MTPRFYDGREIAETLGVSYDDVMAWARRGIIPRIKTGRHVVFNLDRVVEALRSRPNEREALTAVATAE